jgi:hypothetical protein
MSDENWKPVVGFEDFYEVSDCGNLRSLPREITQIGRGGKPCARRLKGRSLKPWKSKNGYMMINLSRDGKDHHFLVHRVVLTTFAGPCPDGMEGCHDNGDAENNRLGNLRWDTPLSNHADRIKHGTSGKGEANSRAILAPAQVAAIKSFERKRGDAVRIAQLFGVKEATISAIVRGENWKDVDPALFKADPAFSAAIARMRSL